MLAVYVLGFFGLVPLDAVFVVAVSPMLAVYVIGFSGLVPLDAVFVVAVWVVFCFPKHSPIVSRTTPSHVLLFVNVMPTTYCSLEYRETSQGVKLRANING